MLKSQAESDDTGALLVLGPEAPAGVLASALVTLVDVNAQTEFGGPTRNKKKEIKDNLIF